MRILLMAQFLPGMCAKSECFLLLLQAVQEATGNRGNVVNFLFV